MMGNCYKLFVNDRLYGVFKTETHAENVAVWLQDTYKISTYRIELSYVADIGF